MFLTLACTIHDKALPHFRAQKRRYSDIVLHLVHVTR